MLAFFLLAVFFSFLEPRIVTPFGRYVEVIGILGNSTTPFP
jgi:hypothetical protein